MEGIIGGVTQVFIVDQDGNPLAIGGGTQYTEGATDASITGTVAMWEDAGDAPVPVSAAKPMPVKVGAATTGGATPGKLISAATTNATSVKGSAGTLYFCAATNNGAAPAYVKWYNKASAPTVGTDVPVLVFEIPANATATLGAGTNIPLGPVGAAFGTGIAFALTGGIADNDTTALAANQVTVNYGFN